MMTIKDGNIGINETNPTATLHVKDVGSTQPAILVEGAGNTEGDIAVKNGDHLQTGHWDGSTFTERFRIGSKGALGLEGDNYGNSGQVLSSKGANYPPGWVDASSGPKGQKGEANVGTSQIQVFTSSGTWTKPSSGNMVTVHLWGGGGGGGQGQRGAGGGGGGAYGEYQIKMSDLPSSVTVTIGNGGSVASSPGGADGTSQGSSGGTTSFGSYFYAYGGAGGRGCNNGGPGTPSSQLAPHRNGGNGGSARSTGGGGQGGYQYQYTSSSDGSEQTYAQAAASNLNDNTFHGAGGGYGGGGGPYGANSNAGGNNLKAGAGGGGASSGYHSNSASGGNSYIGGNGGNGKGSGGDAQAPGGGGGGMDSAGGARGEVWVVVV